MWMFRVGKRSRWMVVDPHDPATRLMRKATLVADVEAAATDLKPRDGEDLSVYRTESDATTERVAVLFAATVRLRPKDLEYVLIPDECLAGFQHERTSSEDGAEELRARHHEILGLRDASRRLDLAASVLAHPETRVTRVSEETLVNAARGLCTDARVRSALVGEWPALLGVES